MYKHYEPEIKIKGLTKKEDKKVQYDTESSEEESENEEVSLNIEELMKTPLSGEQVLKLVDNKAKLLTYTEVVEHINYLKDERKMADEDILEKLIGKHGNLIILYLTGENIGHWVGLIKHVQKKSKTLQRIKKVSDQPAEATKFKHNDYTVEMFDSYGYVLDDQLEFVPHEFRKMYKEDLPHLLKVIFDSGRKVEYNDAHLQSSEDGISTCGFWVATRINNKDTQLEEFINSFLEVDDEIMRWLL
jgi:hypothetical protein